MQEMFQNRLQGDIFVYYLKQLEEVMRANSVLGLISIRKKNITDLK